MIRYSTGYLSKFEGSEIDEAVERVRGLDNELNLKVDKTLEVNGHPLRANINLTAHDVDALPNTTEYGRSVDYSDGTLYLKDQDGVVLSSTALGGSMVIAYWGDLRGNIADQGDLQEALDSKASVTIRDWIS